MPKTRFILRYTGPGEVPDSDLVHIRGSMAVLDSTLERMLLVEASATVLQEVLVDLVDWEAVPERIVPLPSTRRTARRGHKP